MHYGDNVKDIHDARASDVIEMHSWLPDACPPCAGVWASAVGRLTGCGRERRQGVLEVFDAHLVTHGRGMYHCPNGAFELGPGDWFWHWPGVPFEFYDLPDSPWQYYWLRLTGPGAERFARDCGAGPERLVHPSGDPGAAVRDFRDLFECYSLPVGRDPYRGLSLLFSLGAACRAGRESVPGRSRSRSELVAEARAVIENSLDTGINVTDLAGILHVSRATLATAFRQELGQSPVACLMQARIDRAKRLLCETEHKMAVIASACGFSDEKYFLYSFHRLAGVTPGSYRRGRANSFSGEYTA